MFGIVGGYLIDRFGRRRIVVFSLLLYGVSTVAAALAWSPATLLAARCATLIGVSLEFVAALTWLAELFPEPERRDRVLGYSQIASGIGNFAVTATYYGAVTFAERLPALGGYHDPWRYALAAGIFPCVPLLFIRPWLPESPLWLQERARMASRRPAVTNLFRGPLRRSTIMAVFVSACVYGSAYGVLQQAPRTRAQLARRRASGAESPGELVSTVHLFGSLGEVAGRLVFAVLVVSVVRQRRLLRTFMIPALVVVPCVFMYASVTGITALKAASFAATLLVTAQFSFLGNYLPRLFPTYLRGTGESIAINIGGRVLGTSAAFATPQLAGVFHGSDAALPLALAMTVVAVVTLGSGCLLTAVMPEPANARLPDAPE